MILCLLGFPSFSSVRLLTYERLASKYFDGLKGGEEGESVKYLFGSLIPGSLSPLYFVTMMHWAFFPENELKLKHLVCFGFAFYVISKGTLKEIIM